MSWIINLIKKIFGMKEEEEKTYAEERRDQKRQEKSKPVKHKPKVIKGLNPKKKRVRKG
jgi:hypothetical protein